MPYTTMRKLTVSMFVSSKLNKDRSLQCKKAGLGLFLARLFFVLEFPILVLNLLALVSVLARFLCQ